MKLYRMALATALVLAISGPADAASRTAQAAKDKWSASDRCTKAARDLYPDTTAESLAKRDDYTHKCQREAGVPIRQGQAPKN